MKSALNIKLRLIGIQNKGVEPSEIFIMIGQQTFIEYKKHSLRVVASTVHTRRVWSASYTRTDVIRHRHRYDVYVVFLCLCYVVS